MTSRGWCWTLNNYTNNELISLKDIGEQCRYTIYGMEKGENGTCHLQGYTEVENPKRISGMKKLPGLERAHFEKRRGSREQARNYCMKDGEWIEFGDWSAGGQGQRNDLRKVMNSIRDQKKTIEIMEEDPEIYARNLRFCEKYQALVDKEETKTFRNVETHVLWGEAGSGKSRTAAESAPDAFRVDPTEAFPFDGYDGETEIIIDDYYGQFKWCKLLNILDGYQFRVNVKGSHRYAKWNKIFITSNVEPKDWYKRGLKPELARRLTSVTKFTCHDEAGNTIPPQDPDIVTLAEKI